jgi:hypothetical protein
MPVTRMIVVAADAASFDVRRRQRMPTFAPLVVAGARAAVIRTALADPHPHRTMHDRRARTDAPEALEYP